MTGVAKRFLQDDSGATAIEYGLLVGLISVSIIAAAMAIGGGVQARFDQVKTFVAS